MDSQIYVYAFVEALYNKGQDYIDSFWPFVLTVLPLDKSPSSPQDIQTSIVKKHGLHIPLHSLSTIITRAKRKGYVSQREHLYSLSDSGIEHLNGLETEREVQRRTNELLEDARDYFKSKKNLALTVMEVESMLVGFFTEHTTSVELFLNPACEQSQEMAEVISASKEQAVLDYCREVELSKPRIFDTMRDMICGCLITKILCSANIEDQKRSFGKTAVFLDTNTLFSILGLHHSEFNQAAQELHRLMMSTKRFELWAYDFTVAEMIGVVKKYPSMCRQYVPSIKVNSIYSSMKSMGWTPSTLRTWIANIDDKLREVGVSIKHTQINILNDELYPLAVRAILSKYKPEQKTYGQNHDISAIRQVAQARHQEVRRIEDTKAIFLSSDRRLAQYSLIELGHKNNATIPEVVPDTVLTNILWLKNPNIIRSIPLHSVIALHSRHMFVDKSIWEGFFASVQRLASSGRIDERDSALLLYDQSIEQALMEVAPSEAASLGDEWVLKRLAVIKSNIDASNDAKIAPMIAQVQELAKADTFKADRIRELSDADVEKDQRVADAFARVKSNNLRRAVPISRVISYFARAVVFVIIALVILKIAPRFLAQWTKYEPTIVIIQCVFTLLGAVGLWFDPTHWWHTIDTWIYEKVVKYLGRSSILDQLEKEILG